jgi:hypothetical protein
MRILENNEPYTIGTEDGEGWLFYFDGENLHDGTYNNLSFDDLLDRECVECYNRGERKGYYTYIELKRGLAFIVTGSERGRI